MLDLLRQLTSPILSVARGPAPRPRRRGIVAPGHRLYTPRRRASAIIVSNGEVAQCMPIGPFGGIMAGPRSPTSAAFTPLDLPNLKLWLRADMGVSLNGSNTAAWDDQSSNAFDFEQSSASAQPAQPTARVAFGGQLAIGFDGVDNYLYNTDFASRFLGDVITNTEFTFFGAVEVISYGTNAAISYENDQIVQDAGGYFGTPLKNVFEAGVGNYDSGDKYTYASIPAGDTFVLTTRHGGGTIGVDVSQGGEVTTASGNTGSLTGYLKIGSNYSGTQFSNIYVAEIAMCSSNLSAGNKTAMQDYMLARYGL